MIEAGDSSSRPAITGLDIVSPALPARSQGVPTLALLFSHRVLLRSASSSPAYLSSSPTSLSPPTSSEQASCYILEGLLAPARTSPFLNLSQQSRHPGPRHSLPSEASPHPPLQMAFCPSPLPALLIYSFALSNVSGVPALDWPLAFSGHLWVPYSSVACLPSCFTLRLGQSSRSGLEESGNPRHLGKGFPEPQARPQPDPETLPVSPSGQSRLPERAQLEMLPLPHLTSLLPDRNCFSS